MAVNFPQNPNDGDTFVSGNTTFAFTNGKWVSATSPDSLVSKSGDTMTGPLTLSGDPVSDDQAASKSYVDSTSTRIVGEIIMWGSSTIPSGWLECNGQSTSSYPALAALYANVPDLRGQFIRGWDNGRGVDAGRSLRSTQNDSTRRPRFTAFTTNDPGNHTHTYTKIGATNRTDVSTNSDKSAVKRQNSASVNSGGGGSHSHSINGGGDPETRPQNMSLMFIVYSG